MALSLADLPEDQISAAHNLSGKTLASGWLVKDIVNAKPGATGGSFSVCYLVEKEAKHGFLKALNILAFLQSDDSDLPKAIAESVNSFNYEKDILTRCRSEKFSKVARLLDSGHENFPGFIVPNVHYLVFEKADSDVRNHLNFELDIDVAWKLRSLHNIATALKQLHSIDVSHQDLKPSNVFVYGKEVSKLGDLGRSLCRTLTSPHSDNDFSGDWRYAPPEAYHGYVLPEWRDKVFAVDCYMLGSLATFYFTGQSMTSLLSQNIPPGISILDYNFIDALPFWRVAFDQALEIFANHLGSYPQKAIFLDVVKMLSDPDPRLRGHRKKHHRYWKQLLLRTDSSIT